MQTCGSFQLGKEIAFSGEADVFHATSSNFPSGAVVKVWRTFDEGAARLVLEGLEAQAAAVAAGCRGILPIYEKGLGSYEWPYCASPAWVRSVRQMIEATNYISADHLERIVDGVLGALEELAAKGGRAHGDLSAGKILLSHDNPSARGFHLQLCDLAPPETAGTYRDDLVALGRIIYQMVRRSERGSQHLNPPLELTEDWKDLGREAGRWLAVCNHLLMADSLSGALAIRHAREALRRRSPRVPRVSQPETSSRRPGAAVIVGILLLAIGSAAAWNIRSSQIAAQTVPSASFQPWLEPGRLDGDLQVRLRGVPREKNGSVRLREVDSAFHEWFQGEMKSQRPRIWGSDDVLETLCTGLTRTMRFTTPEDLAKLPSRVETARMEFPRWVAVATRREQLLERQMLLLESPYDEGFKSFLSSWVQAQANPDFRGEKFDGHVHERTLARFEHTFAGVEALEKFMQGPDAHDLKLRSAGVSPSEVKSWGDNGAQRWMEHVKSLHATRAVTPSPVAVATPVRAGTATPSVAPLPPVPPVLPPEEFAAQEKALNDYLSHLQELSSRVGFNREFALHEQRKFLDLQKSGSFKGIETDSRLVAVQSAFEQLFAGAPFKLSKLAEGWQEQPRPTDGDYVIYSHPVMGGGPPIRMPFHRISSNGVTPPFAISGIEMPLSLAAAVGKDAMRSDHLRDDPPRGPQVWIAAPTGGIGLAKEWLLPAVARANEYLKSSPQYGMFYSTVKDPPPQWETPVNEILPTTAAAIAAALGGRLPTLTEWRLAKTSPAADLAQQHLPGAQFQKEQDKVEQARVHLGKPFQDIPEVNSKISPDTGSYQENSLAREKVNPSNAVTELWFWRVNRSSEQQPEKIHDLIGNIAELVTSGDQYYAIGGSSISPGNPTAPKPLKGLGGWMRKSDVGFRLVVDLAPTDDRLASFMSTVKNIK